jgi:hypothetical protein
LLTISHEIAFSFKEFLSSTCVHSLITEEVRDSNPQSSLPWKEFFSWVYEFARICQETIQEFIKRRAVFFL